MAHASGATRQGGKREATSGDDPGVARDPLHLISVSDAAEVRASSRLLRVPQETRTGAMWGNADRGAPQTGEILLSQISVRAIEAVCRLMVASFDLETLMCFVP